MLFTCNISAAGISSGAWKILHGFQCPQVSALKLLDLLRGCAPAPRARTVYSSAGCQLVRCSLPAPFSERFKMRFKPLPFAGVLLYCLHSLRLLSFIPVSVCSSPAACPRLAVRICLFLVQCGAALSLNPRPCGIHHIYHLL